MNNLLTEPTNTNTLPAAPHRRLNPGQVAQYRREGYLIVPEPIFAEEKFLRLKTHFDAKLAALPAGERPGGHGRAAFRRPGAV